jgi:eukaryotic-like serine/threonine-protein kinase
MLIQCPFCGRRIRLKNVRPGRYAPRCSACQQAFHLLVPDDASEEAFTGRTEDELNERLGELLLKAVDIEDVGGEETTWTDDASPDAGDEGGRPRPLLPRGKNHDLLPRLMPRKPRDGTGAPLADSSPPGDDAGTPGPPPRAGESREPARSTPSDDDDDEDQAAWPTGLASESDDAAPVRRTRTLDAAAAYASKKKEPPKPLFPTEESVRQQTLARAKKPPPEATDADAAPAQGELSGTLDGYELVQLLGRGGMGEVYLATQLSLDRPVALKTMSPKWAGDPLFLSRFTREAFAAAQLVHHNIVQIYDVGEDRGTPFFSMEYVQGQTLSALLKQKGKIDVEEAAGYILQAARGLRFAHEHGMVHRDVKPDNLMVNEEGIVKVADLGLVKTRARLQDAAGAARPRAHLPASPTGGRKKGGKAADAGATVTAIDVAMGTPAYMAPEQARDAGGVDARADIYSLGCTFYALVTGRPVFEGKTSAELLTKHATEAIIPPDEIEIRVPSSVSEVIQLMLAKRPEDRFQSMDQVIRALEDFLGVSAGPFTPGQEHVAVLEGAVAGFNGSSPARVRRWLGVGFAAVCVTAAAALAMIGHAIWAGGLIGLLVLTLACRFVLTGLTRKTYLFRKVRQLVLGSSVTDWLMWLSGAVAALALLWMFNWLWVWLAFCVLAAGLAVPFHFSVDRLAQRDRQHYVDRVKRMLREMRFRGLEEDALHRFVCRYSSKQWEGFFESLFGYEAKIAARRRWGHDDEGRPRPKSGAWRDGLVEWIDRKQASRDEARQRRHLQKVEERRLVAQGQSEDDARQKSQQVADGLVATAAQMKETVAAASPSSDDRSNAETQPSTSGGGGRRATNVVKLLYGDEDEAGVRQPQGPGKPRGPRLAGMFMGGGARLLVGVVLIAVAVFWMRQRGLLPSGTPGVEDLKKIDLGQLPAPLSVPAVPDAVMRLVCSYGSALAGLVLVLSAFVSGTRMTFFVLPAVLVLMFGDPLASHLPGIGPLTPRHVLLAGGVALGLAAVYWGRKRA